MKRNRAIYSLLLLSIFIGLAFIPAKIHAATKKINIEQCNNGLHSTPVCKHDDFVYYTVNNKIYRYDTVHKKKSIIHTSKDFHYFSNLCIYNGKLLCTADRYAGTDFADYYLFQIDLDGSHPVCITKGQAPSILHHNIYYIKYGNADFEHNDMRTKGIYMLTNDKKQHVILKNKSVTRCTTDGQFLYYCVYHDKDSSITWYSYSPNNKKNVKLVTFYEDNIGELSISSKEIYYSTEKGIFRYDVKTKKRVKLLTLNDNYYTGNGTVTNDSIYYSNAISSTKTNLYKYDIKTKKSTRLLTAPGVCAIYSMGSILGYEKFYSTNVKYNTNLCLRLLDGSIVTLKKYFVS